MIGYDPAMSWGHLTSGGTIANFEALWLARSVRYLPLAVAGAADELGLVSRCAWATAGRAARRTAALGAAQRPARGRRWICGMPLARRPAGGCRARVSNHTLAGVGYQEYSRRLAIAYGDPLPAGVVLAAASAHYSWEKIVRTLGIGSNQLVYVPVDRHYRMDPDALWDRVADLARRRQPILACVSVCGSTEESAVDRLDRVLEVRARAERELGDTFHVHSDACYGGYAAAVTRQATAPAEARMRFAPTSAAIGPRRGLGRQP